MRERRQRMLAAGRSGSGPENIGVIVYGAAVCEQFTVLLRVIHSRVQLVRSSILARATGDCHALGSPNPAIGSGR
jgi:hypothetical protein